MSSTSIPTRILRPRGKQGIRNFGTAIVAVGDKKEEAKSMKEEGITGAFIRDSEE